MVIESVGVHGADQAYVVGARCRVLHEIRILRAALAIRLEHARAAQHGRVGFDERQLYLFGHGLGQRLALPFLQLGLGIEEIHLAGRAFHEEENDALGFRREVRLGSERISTLGLRGAEHLRERDHAEPARAVAEKIAARLNPLECFEGHDLLSRNELIKIHEHAAHTDPRRKIGAAHAFRHIGRDNRHRLLVFFKQRLLFVEIFRQIFELVRIRLAADGQRESVAEPVLEISWRFAQGSLSKSLGGFQKHWIVEQIQSLERCIGTPPPRA